VKKRKDIMTTETVVAELKSKLNEAIDKRMLFLKQSKTEAVDAIAVPLKVQPRQVWKWLSEDVSPQNATDIILTLDSMISEMDKGSKMEPVAQSAPMSFPFQITIQKDTLKLSKDAHGNIVIRGLLSTDLI
jgi:hypothetical protein